MNVEDAIQHIRSVVSEWDTIGMDTWREDHTRYSVIDPIIRSLGWNIADPKECHPEYPRPSPGGRVDYALFQEISVDDVASGEIPPIIIIEAKALRDDLATHVEQLQRYVAAEPAMSEGVAVLTNGNQWWIYNLAQTGDFEERRVGSIDIISGRPRESARLLRQWLGRNHWR